jgi:hypothetical protein
LRFAQYAAPPSNVHFVSGDEQPSTQLPPAQTDPAAHWWPQLPQLSLSDCAFTHVGFPASAPHITSLLDGHVEVHAPETHACPPPHATPHLPQLSVSRDVSTHASPHAL